MAAIPTRLLVLAKTSPAPEPRFLETSCVIGLTEDGLLVRLFPVPFRLVADDHAFRRGQWVTVPIQRALGDSRRESHRLFVERIGWDTPPAGEAAPTVAAALEGLRQVPVYDDFADLEAARLHAGVSLGLVRPARILELQVTALQSAMWTAEEAQALAYMQQQSSLHDALHARQPAPLPAKVPFNFRCRYECLSDGRHLEYSHKVVDLALLARYRRLSEAHGGAGWMRPLRRHYEEGPAAQRSLLLLGTTHRFTDRWLCLGLLGPDEPLTPA